MYFFDDKALEIRNIEDPSDSIKFQDMDMTKLEEP